MSGGLCGPLRSEYAAAVEWARRSGKLSLKPVAAAPPRPEPPCLCVIPSDAPGVLSWNWIGSACGVGGKAAQQIHAGKRPNSKHATCVRAVVDKFGLPDKCRAVSAPRQQQAREMRSRGMTYRQIASATGWKSIRSVALALNGK